MISSEVVFIDKLNHINSDVNSMLSTKKGSLDSLKKLRPLDADIQSSAKFA